MRFLLLSLVSLIGALPVLAADNPPPSAPNLAPLKKWIAQQDEVRSVQADFTQKRAFRSLRDPLASPGKFWFGAPGNFRWEVGDPAKTIVLRQGADCYIIQPKKKRAERLSMANINKKSGERGLPMLEFPLAKNFADFNRRFEALAIKTEGNNCHVEFLPRDAQARKFLEAIKLDFNTENGHLHSFEIALRDGSYMRNDFTNVRMNQKLDRDTFNFDLTGYDIVDAKD
jgi:outer membrane lipoprotein-sorting protein